MVLFYFFRFGARAAGLQSSVMILRILRDLQAWSPHWKSLKNFALELIVEKSLASVGLPLSPGDALRRVFEAISGMKKRVKVRIFYLRRPQKLTKSSPPI